MHIIDIYRHCRQFQDNLRDIAAKLDLPAPVVFPNAGDVGMMTVKFGGVAKATIAVCDDRPLSEIVASIVLLHDIQWRRSTKLYHVFRDCLCHYGVPDGEIFFDDRAGIIVSKNGNPQHVPLMDEDPKETLRLYIVEHVVSTNPAYKELWETYDTIRRHCADFDVKFHFDVTDFPAVENMGIIDCASGSTEDKYVNVIFGKTTNLKCTTPNQMKDFFKWAVHSHKLPNNIRESLTKYRKEGRVLLMDWHESTGAVIMVDDKGPFQVQSRQEISTLVDRSSLGTL